MPQGNGVPQGNEEGGEQLRTRLARERQARADAEAIAERATRDLYQRQQELQLVEAVAVAANEAVDIAAAIQVALDAVCAHTRWPVGHAYLLDDEAVGPRLVSPRIWHLDDPDRFAQFREISEATEFAPGVGLPGRVLESREPLWIIDVTKDQNFPRAQPAIDIGVRAAFGFPVLVGEEAVAVLEFFSPRPAPPDDSLLAVMTQVGTQLGRVVERRRGAEQLERLGRHNQLLLDSAGEGIYGLDSEGTTTFVNPAASRMLGWSAEELHGKPIHAVVHPKPTGEEAPHPLARCWLHRTVAAGTPRSADDDVFFRRDGTSFPVEYIITPILEVDEVAGAVLTFSDIADRKRFEAQLQHLADHDPLTELFNRRRFEEELLRKVTYGERYPIQGAVLLLDLDNFKYVNDTLGHRAGDELMRNIAGILRKRLRTSDIIARLGGDEFGVLLEGTDGPEADAVAEELLGVVRKHGVAIGGQPMRVTTSIGLTLLGREGISAENLLVEADIAMYQAKEAGRDQVVAYSPGRAAKDKERIGFTWTERIRKALEEDRFVLYAQPIFDLSLSRISQYELLLRMTGDDGSIYLPGAFLPPAERFGLIERIDAWVVRHAIRLLADEAIAGRDLELLLEVNLSGRSVGDPELPLLIERELSENSVDPGQLIFEITETAAIANMDRARQFALRLERLGCRFALDDFGAGFGSFYYLKYFPIHYLKIDGDFIRALSRSMIDKRMVKAMVEIASGLGMKTIAEFVEDEATLILLREYGVDFAQGYHIGRPKPVAEVLAARSVRR